MVHVIINGIIVEAETITELQITAQIKKYKKYHPKKERKNLKEDDTITQIMREVLAQIKSKP